MWYVYNIMKLDINRFDTSDFIDKPYDIPLANKKVPGLVKDENNDWIPLPSWLNSLDLKSENVRITYIRKEGHEKCQEQCCSKIHNVNL